MIIYNTINKKTLPSKRSKLMRLVGTIQVLAKLKNPWVDSNGNEKISYSANILQNNGEIIDTIRLSLEQFNSIEAGTKPYQITTDFGTGRNGGYLRIIDITPSKQ
jgi:hypothetical protein